MLILYKQTTRVSFTSALTACLLHLFIPYPFLGFNTYTRSWLTDVDCEEANNMSYLFFLHAQFLGTLPVSYQKWWQTFKDVAEGTLLGKGQHQ